MKTLNNQPMQKIMLLLALLACQLVAFATQEVEEESNTGLGLTSDLTVTSSKHDDILPGWETALSIPSVQNEITFGIDPSLIQVGPEYNYRNVFALSWDEIVDGDLETVTVNGIELNLNYYPDQAYRDKEVYAFNGGLEMRLTNIQLQQSTDGGVSFVPSGVDRENLFLKAAITTEYYDAFAYATTPSDAMSIVVDGSDWVVNCPTLVGADQYYLEWTWVNGYAGTETGGIPDVLAETAVEYDFRNNAALVRVRGNSYHVPMIYGDGYLLVRYRGVGRIPAHPQADIDGVWNTNGTWGYVDHGTVA
ncbi:MAG: hypothetical protein ACFB10_17950, partial [Salibacteraceae bacterium]